MFGSQPSEPLSGGLGRLAGIVLAAALLLCTSPPPPDAESSQSKKSHLLESPIGLAQARKRRPWFGPSLLTVLSAAASPQRHCLVSPLPLEVPPNERGVPAAAIPALVRGGGRASKLSLSSSSGGSNCRADRAAVAPPRPPPRAPRVALVLAAPLPRPLAGTRPRGAPRPLPGPSKPPSLSGSPSSSANSSASSSSLSRSSTARAS